MAKTKCPSGKPHAWSIPMPNGYCVCVNDGCGAQKKAMPKKAAKGKKR